ncbi:MAG: Holliday junction resolvase RuvX [Anaerolineae bacterium]
MLALDVGDERIGVAISDESATLARPLEILERVSGPASFLRIADIVSRQGVVRIIVGLPLLENGSRGKQVASTEAYVRGLAKYVEVPIVMCDERYTTREARELMGEPGGPRRKVQAQVDAVAAAVILQDYISQQTEEAR